VLVASRVEVERGRIRHVATGVIGNDRNVIANLVLVRITFERIKRIANSYVRRPGNTGVGAVRIK
jgi:hypothetical protein